jgi:uncharacterized repeat protein (TIGR04076 family)
MAFQVGYRVVGTILEVKGECHAGHKVGDTIELSGHHTGGLCGFFYHDIFPDILMLQFGATYPEKWMREKDVRLRECLDKHNLVRIELRRVGEYRPPAYETKD